MKFRKFNPRVTVLAIIVFWCIGGFHVFGIQNENLPLDMENSQSIPDGSPATHSAAEQSIENAITAIGSMEGIYSLLVSKDGSLIIERYFREGSKTKPHNLKSATKSVLSSLTGIAVDKGMIRLDQSIGDFIPMVKKMNDARKQDITIRHLLTMTSGLEPSSYDAYQLWITSGDWVEAILNRPLVENPGTTYQYSTGDTHLLAAVLTAATHMSVRDFAFRNLFDPMDITVHGWDVDPQGIQQGGNNLSLIPEDIMKFGQLFLDRGRFHDQVLVPEWWIDVSTRPGYLGHHDVYGYYGYLWYAKPGGHDAFVAVGYGGQYIYVSKEHNLVVVVLSTLVSKGDVWEQKLFDLIQNRLFSALPDSQSSIAANGKAMTDDLPVKNDDHYDHDALNQKAIVLTNLNLREGPGKDQPRCKVLKPGTVLGIIDEVDGWSNVVIEDQTGWVASSFVKVVEPEKIEFAKPPAPESPASDMPQKTAARINEPAAQLPLPPKVRPDLNDEIDALKNDLATQKQQLNELAARTSVMDEQMVSIQKQMNDSFSGFQNRVDQIYSDVVQTRNQLILEKESQDENIKIQLSVLKNEIQAEKADRQGLVNDLTGIREQLKLMEKHVLNNQTIQTTLYNDVDGLKAKNAALETEINGEKNNIKIMTQTLEDLGSVKGNVAELQNELHRQKEQLRTIEADASGAADQQQERIRNLEASQSRIALDMQTLKAVTERQSQFAEQSESALESLILNHGNLQTGVISLENKVETLQRETHDVEVFLSAVQEKMAALKEELRYQIAGINDQNDVIKKDFDGGMIERQRLKSDLAAVLESIRLLETRLIDTDNQKSMEFNHEEKTISPPPIALSLDLIQAFIEDWEDAWEKKDIERYLACYSLNFKPSGRINRDEWEKIRRQRLLGPEFIDITISEISAKQVDSDQVMVAFHQLYRSDRHEDQVMKTLVLIREKESWSIVREMSRPIGQVD